MFGRKKQQALKDRVNTIAARARPRSDQTADRMPRKVFPRAERLSSFADCKVYYAGAYAVSGILVDYSASGARIRFRHRHALPERVRIVCHQYNIDCDARVVRRLDFDVGLQFID